MSSTTLMTFILQTPPSTASVDLLGSWDNFSKPYPMQKDLRTGRGHWRGCHTFENIICDGELDNSHQKRNGGLKMGGKYWYFYQLNGEVEYHNPAEPSTTSCPLLPGQPVNVLEVPIQIGGEDQRSRNGSTSPSTPAACTMNPNDKYLNPRPAPVPKLSCFSSSQTSFNKMTVQMSSPQSGRSPWSSRSKNRSQCSRSSPTPSPLLSYARKFSIGRVSRSLSPRRASMPRVALRRSRAPLSAGAESEPDRGRRRGVHVERKIQIGEPVLISRTDEARHCIPLREAQSESPSRSPSFSPSPSEEPRSTPSLAATPQISQQDIYLSQSTHSESSPRETSSLRNSVHFEEVDFGSDLHEFQGGSKDLGIERTICPALLEAPSECQPQAAQHGSLEYSIKLPNLSAAEKTSDVQAFITSSTTALPQNATTLDIIISDTLKPPALPKSGARPQLLRSHFSAWSSTTVAPSPTSPDTVDDHTSPSLTSATDTSSDPLSPYRLSFHFDTQTSPELDNFFNSRPGTHTPPPYEHPAHRSADINDDLSTFDTNPYCGHTTFQGYSLSAHEHASDLTLRKIPTPQRLPEPAIGSQNCNTGLVQSWNDGSAHRLTATEELLDDLAYLGGMIVPY